MAATGLFSGSNQADVSSRLEQVFCVEADAENDDASVSVLELQTFSDGQDLGTSLMALMSTAADAKLTGANKRASVFVPQNSATRRTATEVETVFGLTQI